MSYGKITCVVGDTGAGKTTYIMNFAKKAKSKDVLIYLRIPEDINIANSKKYTNATLFINDVSKKKDSLIIIDEAFTFLPKNLRVKMDKPNDLNNLLADILVNARKMNNYVFIIYHSFSQIPYWLIPYLNNVVRFRTNDQMNYQSNRFMSFPILANNLLNVPMVRNHIPEVLNLR